MEIKKVKVAVIGCGMISDTYLDNLKNTFHITELVGCADIVEEKARKQSEKYGIKYMTTEEILNDPEIEIVLNLTYPTSHYEVSKAILNAKKHCYSEKMMCLNLKEADELKEIAKRNKVHFAVAPDTFLGASQQTARYLIDKGMIGQPVSFLVSLTRGYHMIKTTQEDAYRKYSVMYEGGGIPYDMGGYYLHQLFNMFGPIDKICGFITARNKIRPYLNPRHEKFNEPFEVSTYNTVSASLLMDCGITGTFQLSSEYNTSENLFIVTGTEGQINLADPNMYGDKVYITKGNGEKCEFPLSHPYAGVSFRGIGVADMAYAIRTNRPCRLSFEMGYHALECIEAIKKCTETGQVQTLKTKFPRPVPFSSEYYNGTSQERSLFIY